MSTKNLNCVTVTCDSCDEDAPLYEDMGTCHWPTVEDARKDLIAEHADEPEYAWSSEGDEWLCPTCTAKKACAAAGGHDWGEWNGYGGPREFRACVRPACDEHEWRETRP